MSNQGAGILATQRKRITEVVMALLAPVLLTFLLYLASSAAGAPTPAAVGYIIVGVGTTAPAGVSCIWVGPIATATCGGGLAAPTFFVNLIDGVILFVVFVVVAIQGLKLAAAALESRED